MPEPADWNHRYATRDTPWDSGQVSVELKRMLEEVPIPPRRCLEIGCGTGNNAIQQAQAAAQRVGVKVNFRASIMSCAK